MSVNSPTTSNLPQRPTVPTFRYWYYESANDVIGEIRYESSGGETGRWGWVPTAVGKDCAVPYVIFTLAGLPKGTYQVSAHIPDVADLATKVEYGNIVVDQAAYRGSWAPLGRYQVNADSPDITVLQSQPYASFGESGGCQRGERRVAYDAIRAVRL